MDKPITNTNETSVIVDNINDSIKEVNKILNRISSDFESNGYSGVESENIIKVINECNNSLNPIDKLGHLNER